MKATSARPGCGEPATTRFHFDASSSRVILDAHIELWGGSGVLCDRHSLRLTAPRGWELEDQRIVAPRLFPVARFDEPRRLQATDTRHADATANDTANATGDDTGDDPGSVRAPLVHASQAAFELPDDRTPLLARAFEAAGSRVRATSTLESLIPRSQGANPAVAG